MGLMTSTTIQFSLSFAVGIKYYLVTFLFRLILLAIWYSRRKSKKNEREIEVADENNGGKGNSDDELPGTALRQVQSLSRRISCHAIPKTKSGFDSLNFSN